MRRVTPLRLGGFALLDLIPSDDRGLGLAGVYPPIPALYCEKADGLPGGLPSLR